MDRRTFLQTSLALTIRRQDFGTAADVLAKATASGLVEGAALHVRHKGKAFSRTFGVSKSPDDMFLLASITKTMTAAALMTLHDFGKFKLDDPAKKFLPKFTGDGRDTITIRQLLTHVNGLPDQLPENQDLRRRHAKLPEFVERAMRTPLLFKPGACYSYSSMAVLLASEIAARISGTRIHDLFDITVFTPLKMKHSVLGLGQFPLEKMMKGQIKSAAPESGSGDPTAKNWDWNSPYWRAFGAPWGGAHGSAGDVARFLAAFLHPDGKLMKPETARLMIRNHNPNGFRPRGLGFDLGSPGCSDKTFGHTGSTGTLMWADPESDTICVVLTTLPGRAANPHPRRLASDLVAKAVKL